MSETHSAPSLRNVKRDDTGSADPSFVVKLQQAANLANENCDRATVLAQKLSAQLREAQSRVNELELEADGLASRIWAEAEAAIAKLQFDANARFERAKHAADARIARVEAEVESRVRRLQAELAQAQQLTDRARADAQIAQERIARAETEADERLRRVCAEIEDRFMRHKSDLAQAERRADRAEQWLVLIQREIEDHLMPSFATPESPIVGGSEASRRVPSNIEPQSFSDPSSVVEKEDSALGWEARNA
jgi:multidrug efflux pump subunit AcrA (membrane-fusion protein)